MSFHLTKSESVLTLSKHARNGAVEFRAEGEGPVVSIDPERWVDFGRPDEITVTVQAGDRLHDERGER